MFDTSNYEIYEIFKLFENKFGTVCREYQIQIPFSLQKTI